MEGYLRRGSSAAILTRRFTRPLVTPMSLPAIVPVEEIKTLEQQRRIAPVDEEVLARVRRRQEIFLENFRVTHSVAAAEEAAGISAGTFYRWRRRDPDFCRAYNNILGDVHERLKAHVIRRAFGERPRDADGAPAVDADGAPVYRNGNDKILTMLLGMHEKLDVHSTFEIKMVPPPGRVINENGEVEDVKNAG